MYTQNGLLKTFPGEVTRGEEQDHRQQAAHHAPGDHSGLPLGFGCHSSNGVSHHGSYRGNFCSEGVKVGQRADRRAPPRRATIFKPEPDTVVRVSHHESPQARTGKGSTGAEKSPLQPRHPPLHRRRTWKGRQEEIEKGESQAAHDNVKGHGEPPEARDDHAGSNVRQRDEAGKR